MRVFRSQISTGLAIAAGLAIAGCAKGGDTARDSTVVPRDPTHAPIIAFAASDLRDALREVAERYQIAGGDSVVLVFGSTGDLGAQIANGAPADVFFAANAAAIDSLAAHRQIVDSTRAIYAIGRLALIAKCAPAATATATCDTLALADLAKPAVRTIAIADPAHAPYGLAAKQALERAGLWSRVERKLVMGANISQAEQFVATGNADAGLVALSLVLRDSTRRYTLVDSALHAPLRQTVAVIASSRHPEHAIGFVRFLRGADGQPVMRRYGFTAPP